MAIGARASEWHSGNADVHALPWIARFIGGAVVYVAVLAIVGSVISRRRLDQWRLR